MKFEDIKKFYQKNKHKTVEEIIIQLESETRESKIKIESGRTTVKLPKEAEKIKLDVDEKEVSYEVSKRPELKVGDYVEILSDAYTFNNVTVVEDSKVKSAVGKIGRISTIDNTTCRIIGLPSECYHSVQSYWVYRLNQVKKVKVPNKNKELLPIGTRVMINKDTFMGKIGIIKEYGIATYVIRIDDNQHVWGCLDINVNYSDVYELNVEAYPKPKWTPNR